MWQQARDAKHNLPPQPTPFIGREAELAELGDLLADASCRLLTLCGPGGMGKTRLAIEAATHNIEHFPDGVWMANLEPLAAADDIIPTVMTALDLPSQGGHDLRQQLLDYLRDQHTLLIMDNFEHLLDGVSLVSDMLKAAPGLKIMATSREVLNLREEWVRRIRGLDVPDDEQVADLDAYSAVQLFVAGARRVRGSFSFDDARACVVRLCQLVGGLPLALELAASWLQVMPCSVIIEELQKSLDILESPLGNMPERHRSMRAAFDQSWQLLSDEERAVFKKLAVFRGGFFREAAAFVSEATLSILSSLVVKALLRVDGDGRYHLHSLLRQYAYDKLRDSPEDYTTARDQHCHYYTEFLHKRYPDVWYSQDLRAMNEIAVELDNIRRALEWALEQQNATRLMKAIATFASICYRSGLWEEGYIVYGRIVAVARSVEDKAVLWRALAVQGWFAHYLSDYEQADRLYEEALTIGHQSRWHPNAQFKAFLMFRLSESAMRRGDLANARRFVEDSVIDGNPSHDALAMWVMEIRSKIEYLAGNYQEANKLIQDGLAVARSFHHHAGIAAILNRLGRVLLAQKDYVAARQAFTESVAHAQGWNTWRSVIRSQVGLGHTSFLLGEYDTARSYFYEALEAAREIGDSRIMLNAIIGMAELLMMEGQEDQALAWLLIAQEHPAADWETREKAKRLVSELEDELPSETIAQANENAKRLDLDTIINTILAERPVAPGDEVTVGVAAGALDEDHRMSRTSPVNSLPESIRSVNQALSEPLTSRELEVLTLLASGHSNRQIAEQLFIGVNTVKKHVTHIYGKLDVSSRTQAINRLREMQLL